MGTLYGSIRCMCEHHTDCTCLRTSVDHCMWPVRVPVMAMSAHAGSWPHMTAYVPSTGKNRCACTTYKHGLLMGIQGLYRLKKPVELLWGPYGMPHDHPRVTGILALTVPVNYPRAPCDRGIRDYSDQSRVFFPSRFVRAWGYSDQRRTFFLLRKFCCGYIKIPYI